MSEQILTWLVLAIPLSWLMVEADWLRIKLAISTFNKGMIDIGGVLMLAISMVFLVIGLISFPIHHGILVILISPNGTRYKGFTLGQARKYILRAKHWSYEIEKAIIVSPSGKSYDNFNVLQGNRIIRAHPEWQLRNVNE